jgi:hypothetical protein
MLLTTDRYLNSISPVKLLTSRCSCLRFAIRPISTGIGPKMVSYTKSLRGEILYTSRLRDSILYTSKIAPRKIQILQQQQLFLCRCPRTHYSVLTSSHQAHDVHMPLDEQKSRRDNTSTRGRRWWAGGERWGGGGDGHYGSGTVSASRFQSQAEEFQELLHRP